MSMAAKNYPMLIINIKSKISRKRCHESALMAAAHILLCLTQEGKSISK
jgi:hypothetical protein